MATLDSLKHALRQIADTPPPALHQTLSDALYSSAFDLLLQGPGSTSYRDFVIPQLSKLLGPVFDSHAHVSILEIGPGPQSILGHLSDRARRKITKYAAYEPNELFHSKMREWLCPSSQAEHPFPCLEKPPDIHQAPFMPAEYTGSYPDERFDIVLFCHSL